VKEGMALPFDVFEELFLFNGGFDAGKHFYGKSVGTKPLVRRTLRVC